MKTEIVVLSASKISFNAGYDLGYTEGQEAAFRKVVEALRDCGLIASEDAMDCAAWLQENKSRILGDE